MTDDAAHRVREHLETLALTNPEEPSDSAVVIAKEASIWEYGVAPGEELAAAVDVAREREQIRRLAHERRSDYRLLAALARETGKAIIYVAGQDGLPQRSRVLRKHSPLQRRQMPVC